MNLDGGAGYIISAIIGSLVMWVFGRIDRSSNHSKEATDLAHEKVDELEKAFLKYQAHVPETYAKIATLERMESGIFAVILRLEQKVDKLLSERSS